MLLHYMLAVRLLSTFFTFFSVSLVLSAGHEIYAFECKGIIFFGVNIAVIAKRHGSSSLLMEMVFR